MRQICQIKNDFVGSPTALRFSTSESNSSTSGTQPHCSRRHNRRLPRLLSGAHSQSSTTYILSTYFPSLHSLDELLCLGTSGICSLTDRAKREAHIGQATTHIPSSPTFHPRALVARLPVTLILSRPVTMHCIYFILVSPSTYRV
jgi:hypothetical protein